MSESIPERDLAIVIPVQGLSFGRHQYSFKLGREFFEQFGNSTIVDADCSVSVEIEKGSAFMGVRCAAEGSVTVECDRCLDLLDIPVEFAHNLTVKYSKVYQEPDDDEVVILEEGETDLDLSQFVYDYICLSVPLVKVHQDGGCNPEMIAKLNGIQGAAGAKEEMNSPFSALKDLLEKSNNIK